jgi:hypothetical protein
MFPVLFYNTFSTAKRTLRYVVSRIRTFVNDEALLRPTRKNAITDQFKATYIKMSVTMPIKAYGGSTRIAPLIRI